MNQAPDWDPRTEHLLNLDICSDDELRAALDALLDHLNLVLVRTERKGREVIQVRNNP